MRVLVWGTYDLGKPRGRILLRGLKENSVEVDECLADIWSGVEDKSQLKGVLPRVKKLLKWLLAYPFLIYRYITSNDHDVVLVGYPGMLDVLILWPFAKLRGKPIVWDAFLSLYNTVVEDRQMISAKNPLAWLLYALEWLSCRAANLVILDTRAHADYFVEKYNISKDKTGVVFVGVEPETFPPTQTVANGECLNDDLTVLFYGQFIPLHGIETIVQAAQKMTEAPVRWVLIGQGQEEAKIRSLLDAKPLARMEWLPWVPYEELIEWIGKADVCLGIFGDTGKAHRVIPNKVFQILSSRKPVITMESPAIRELLNNDMLGVYLVPAANSNALVQVLQKDFLLMQKSEKYQFHDNLTKLITPLAIGYQALVLLRKVTSRDNPRML